MSRPLLVFAPGAGAPSTSPWMQAWQRRLETIGEIVMLDYAYAIEGRRRPDPLPSLVATHRRALQEARAHHGGPAFLVGKSMGGRIGCHLSLEEEVMGLVCLGYPLKSPAGTLRDEVLLALRAPILFVQGTRDALAPLDTLADVRAKMKAPSVLHVVEGGDHSLSVVRARRSAKREADRSEARGTRGTALSPMPTTSCETPAQAAVDARILAATRNFVEAILTGTSLAAFSE